MKKFLPLFSYLLHPVFIGVFAVLIFISQNQSFLNYNESYILLVKTSVFTLFLPLLIFYILVHYNKIDSIMITKVSQRKLPLIFQVILATILLLTLISDSRTIILQYFFYGTILSSLLALIFVIYHQKISLHMLGFSSITVFYFTASIAADIKNIYIFGILLLLNGLLGSSRLMMKAHTLRELFLGAIIGVVPQVVLSFFYL